MLMFKIVCLDGGGTLDGLMVILKCGCAHELDVILSTCWDVRGVLVTILRELQDTTLMVLGLSVCGEHGCFQLVKQP